MGIRGVGSVFRRVYKDRHGTPAETTNWWIQYRIGRATKREATPYTTKTKAVKLLQQRVAAAAAGKLTVADDPTFEELADLIVTDYKNNGRRNLYNLEKCVLPKLRPVLGELHASEISVAVIEHYKANRLKSKAAPATVNRELAALKRMLRLAARQGLIVLVPHISMLTERNVRRGFFEFDEFRAVLEHLPVEYKALFTLAFITGWRVESELLSRRWKHVDFAGKGRLRLDPGDAKDRTQGREFQFTEWMRSALEAQRDWVDDIEKTIDRKVLTVFCRPNGEPIKNYRKAWRSACEAAGVERIPHDFRRTAVRNLERAGVPRAAAMAMVGHRTESIYRRYSIVDEAMLDIGTARLNELHKGLNDVKKAS
jgi:integrase